MSPAPGKVRALHFPIFALLRPSFALLRPSFAVKSSPRRPNKSIGLPGPFRAIIRGWDPTPECWIMAKASVPRQGSSGPALIRTEVTS
jgi:hypothetical protein